MNLQNTWNQQTDVVVVGGGGAGLAAAIEASSFGAEVVLLEKQPQLGGTTSIAVGTFTAACTSLQRAAGVQDDPVWHDEDIGKFAAHREPRNNPALRRFFATQAAETFEWLINLGLDFSGPHPEPPNRVPRMHNVVPNAKLYIAALHRAALKQGVGISCGCQAGRLVRREGGRVAGVEALGPSGESVRWRARTGVILAAGDYAGGRDLKQEFLSRDAALIEGINPNATGDGHRLARAVGADLINMDLVYGPEIRFVPPPGKEPFEQLLPSDAAAAQRVSRELNALGREGLQARAKELLVTWLHPENKLFDKGAILVNQHGRRFVDEIAAPELAIPRQPGKVAHLVFDQALAETFSAWPDFISTAPEIAYAYVADYRRLRPDLYSEAPALEELAGRIGVNARDLARTVESYNEAASGRVRDPLGRTSFGAPLGKPPFYALGPAKSWIVTTEGGVRINERCEVLDTASRVIPGLYACGSTGMGGLVIWGHGLHIAWALTSGRIAGRNAARA